MHYSKLFSFSLALLFSILLLFTIASSSPVIYAQNPTPTFVAPHYAEITADNAQYLKPEMGIGNGYGYLPRWSPDGKHLAIGGSKGVWIMDANALDQPPQPLLDFSFFVRALAYSNDGKLLAAAGGEYTNNAAGYLAIWDTNSNQISVKSIFPTVPIKLTFSPDSRFLAYITMPNGGSPIEIESCIHVLDMTRLSSQDTFTFSCQYGDGDYSFLSFSPDGNWLVFGASMRDIRIINLRTGKRTIKSLSVTNERALGLAHLEFSHDSKSLIVNPAYSHLEPAQVISLDDMQPTHTWQDTQSISAHPIEGNLYYNHDGQKLYEFLTQTDFSILKIWNVRDGTVQASVDLPAFYKISIQNPRNHTLILSRLGMGLTDESYEKDKPNFLVVNDQTGRVLFGFNGFNSTIALSPDGQRIIVFKQFYGLIMESLDATTGKQQPIPIFWTGRTGSIQFHPNGNLISVHTESGIRFWDLHTYSPIYFNQYFWRAALSPDGRWLATQGFQSTTVELYDFQTRRLMRTIQLSQQIYHLAFSADSQTALAVVHNYTADNETAYVVHIDVQSGQVTSLPSLKVAQQPFYDLTATSDDGKLVVFYTTTGVVVWNLETNTTTLLQSTESVPSGDQTFVRWTFNFAKSRLAAVRTKASKNGNGDLGTPLYIGVWDTASGRQVQTINTFVILHDSILEPLPPPIISFSPTSDRLYVRAEEWQQPIVWDIASGKKLNTYPLESRSMMSSPTQEILAAVMSDRIYVVSTTTSSIRWIWPYPARTVFFSPNGKWLVSQNRDYLTLFAVDESRIPTPQPPLLTPIASR